MRFYIARNSVFPYNSNDSFIGRLGAYYDALSFDNIFAARAERLPVYGKDGSYAYPLLWIEKNLRVRNLSISNVYRTEEVTPVSTIYAGENTAVENLELHNVACENRAGQPAPLLDNHGVTERLACFNLRAGEDEIFAGLGKYPVQ